MCNLVQVGISKQPDNLFAVAGSCRKESAASHLPKFLHEQKNKLSAVANYLTTHPKSIKDQPRLEHLLSAILKDPRAALG